MSDTPEPFDFKKAAAAATDFTTPSSSVKINGEWVKLKDVPSDDDEPHAGSCMDCLLNGLYPGVEHHR